MNPPIAASEWKGADFTSQGVDLGPQTCDDGDGLLRTIERMSRVSEVTLDRSGKFVLPPPVCDGEADDARGCTAVVHGDSRAPGDAVAERMRELQRSGYSLILVAHVVPLSYQAPLGLERWPRRCVVGWMTTAAIGEALPHHASWARFLRGGDVESKELPLQLVTD